MAAQAIAQSTTNELHTLIHGRDGRSFARYHETDSATNIEIMPLFSGTVIGNSFSITQDSRPDVSISLTNTDGSIFVLHQNSSDVTLEVITSTATNAFSLQELNGGLRNTIAAEHHARWQAEEDRTKTYLALRHAWDTNAAAAALALPATNRVTK